MTICRLFRVPGLLLAEYISVKNKRLLFYSSILSLVFTLLELVLYKSSSTIFIASSFSYFLSGLYMFYILTTFTDFIPAANNPALFAGMGELFLRVGDMLSYLLFGEWILDNMVLDILIVSLLFTALMLIAIFLREHSHHYSLSVNNIDLKLGLLKEKYDLTERECETASLVIRGMSVPELAR